jgi:hypothetical protein
MDSQDNKRAAGLIAPNVKIWINYRYFTILLTLCPQNQPYAIGF